MQLLMEWAGPLHQYGVSKAESPRHSCSSTKNLRRVVFIRLSPYSTVGGCNRYFCIQREIGNAFPSGADVGDYQSGIRVTGRIKPFGQKAAYLNLISRRICHPPNMRSDPLVFQPGTPPQSN
jgi:hypothetical protein